MVYFQTQNPNFGKFWEGLAMEDVYFWPFSLVDGHLVYFVAISYIYGLEYFSPFWCVIPRKIWQPRFSVKHENIFVSISSDAWCIVFSN
jgi:hypothetical protein